MGSDAAAWHLAHRAGEPGFLAQAAAALDATEGGVLDLGCGSAPLASLARSRGRDWWGVDRDPAMAAAARTRPGAAGRVTLAPAALLPFPDARFGSVVSLGLFEYLERPGNVLAEAARVVAPGGRIALTVPRWEAPVRRWQQTVAPVLRALGRPDPFDLRSGRRLGPADARGWARETGLLLQDARPVAPALHPWPLDRYARTPGTGRAALGTAWLFVFAKGAP